MPRVENVGPWAVQPLLRRRGHVQAEVHCAPNRYALCVVAKGAAADSHRCTSLALRQGLSGCDCLVRARLKPCIDRSLRSLLLVESARWHCVHEAMGVTIRRGVKATGSASSCCAARSVADRDCGPLRRWPPLHLVVVILLVLVLLPWRCIGVAGSARGVETATIYSTTRLMDVHSPVLGLTGPLHICSGGCGMEEAVAPAALLLQRFFSGCTLKSIGTCASPLGTSDSEAVRCACALRGKPSTSIVAPRAGAKSIRVCRCPQGLTSPCERLTWPIRHRV